MTCFLASVRDAAEADRVLGAGADIVDLKDPSKGALGALDLANIRSCVARVGGRVPVSATVGDLPMNPDVVSDAVTVTGACGVDYVKLGIGPGGDLEGCLARLRSIDIRAGLILVFFADALPPYDPIDAALVCGACGVMLDTAGKSKGALTDFMPMSDIARFVMAAREAGLIVGLAGALRPRHVAPLLTLRPNLMGFRGALCREGRRDSGVDAVACGQIRALIPRHGGETEILVRGADAAAVY